MSSSNAVSGDIIRLIPALPNEISIDVLQSIPPNYYPVFAQVSKVWYRHTTAIHFESLVHHRLGTLNPSDPASISSYASTIQTIADSLANSPDCIPKIDVLVTAAKKMPVYLAGTQATAWGFDDDSLWEPENDELCFERQEVLLTLSKKYADSGAFEKAKQVAGSLEHLQWDYRTQAFHYIQTKQI